MPDLSSIDEIGFLQGRRKDTLIFAMIPLAIAHRDDSRQRPEAGSASFSSHMAGGTGLDTTASRERIVRLPAPYSSAPPMPEFQARRLTSQDFASREILTDTFPSAACPG